MVWRKRVAIVRESFHAKIFTLFILVIVVLSFSFTAAYFFHERSSQTENLLMEGRLLSSLLAYNVRLPVFAENRPELITACDGIMEHERVIAVSILSEDGRVLGQRVRSGRGESVGGMARLLPKTLTAPTVRVGEDKIEFLAPVTVSRVGARGEQLFLDASPGTNGSRMAGLVRVVLDKQELNQRLATGLTVLVCFTLLFLVIGSLAAYAAIRGVTRPLNRLAEAVKELERGNLSARITVGSRDEVGQLAHAFNNMVSTLARRDKENRALSQALRLAQKMEAQEEWERTFDTVPDLIAIIDRHRGVVRINRAMAERLGIGKQEAVGLGCQELLHGSCKQESDCPLHSDGEQHERELYVAKLDSYFWVTVTPLRKANGELLGAVHVARDITERKRSEEEKKLIQAKLIQTNKMTSLGLLVSGMAHEVNNPNNNIKLAGHLLAKAWEDIGPILEEYYQRTGDFVVGGHRFSQVRESLPGYITGITESARRIEGIIKNLRDFVRKGKANVSSLTDVNMVVSVAAAILNYQIKKYTSHFRVELRDDLPQIRGNSQLLEQVVINLLMNAIQALPDREHGVRVSTTYDPAAGHVVVTVRDEGCGMPPEVQKRIFEPFFSTKLDSGGTGLGLAISNVIVDEHKGRLEFDSSPGAGTTATIRLPVAQSPEITIPSP
jgi:PAS domain S-box-containing protein